MMRVGATRPPAPLPARRAYRPEGSTYGSERNPDLSGTIEKQSKI